MLMIRGYVPDENVMSHRVLVTQCYSSWRVLMTEGYVSWRVPMTGEYSKVLPYATCSTQIHLYKSGKSIKKNKKNKKYTKI